MSRVDFGAKSILFPMPVLIVSANDVPDKFAKLASM